MTQEVIVNVSSFAMERYEGEIARRVGYWLDGNSLSSEEVGGGCWFSGPDATPTPFDEIEADDIWPADQEYRVVLDVDKKKLPAAAEVLTKGILKEFGPRPVNVYNTDYEVIYSHTPDRSEWPTFGAPSVDPNLVVEQEV